MESYGVEVLKRVLKNVTNMTVKECDEFFERCEEKTVNNKTRSVPDINAIKAVLSKLTPDGKATPESYTMVLLLQDHSFLDNENIELKQANCKYKKVIEDLKKWINDQEKQFLLFDGGYKLKINRNDILYKIEELTEE